MGAAKWGEDPLRPLRHNHPEGGGAPAFGSHNAGKIVKKLLAAHPVTSNGDRKGGVRMRVLGLGKRLLGTPQRAWEGVAARVEKSRERRTPRTPATPSQPRNPSNPMPLSLVGKGHVGSGSGRVWVGSGRSRLSDVRPSPWPSLSLSRSFFWSLNPVCFGPKGCF